MEDLNVVIAGAAGEGVQTIGEILAQTLAMRGYAVFTWKEYESRIRGGQNSYSIRVGEEPNNAPLLYADILLAMNEGAVKKYKGLLKEKGVLIAQDKAKEGMIGAPFDEIAKKEVGGEIYANTIAIGVLTGVLGIDLQTLKVVLKQIFSGKGEEVLEANYKAAEKGFELAERDCRDMCQWTLPPRDTRHLFISGNEAISIAPATMYCATNSGV